jgi:hypothetical protein
MMIHHKIWKIVGNINSNIFKNPDYYRALTLYDDPGLDDFKNIIVMDVKRTNAAHTSENHASKLTRVLLNYSKYAFMLNAGETLRLDTVKD